MDKINSSCDINNLSTRCKLEQNGIIPSNYHNLKQWCNVSGDKLLSISLGDNNSDYLTKSVLNNKRASNVTGTQRLDYLFQPTMCEKLCVKGCNKDCKKLNCWHVPNMETTGNSNSNKQTL